MRYLIVILLIVGFGYLVCSNFQKTLARYESTGEIEYDIQTAFFVIEDGEYSFTMNLGNIKPSASPYVYLFTIANFNEDLTSKVDMEYNLKIITTTNLPLNYKLYRNEAYQTGTSILSPKQTIQDTYESWYNKFTTEESYLLTHDSMTTDSYYLVVEYPLLYKNTLDYLNKIESVDIYVYANQLIAEEENE